jgi:WD40 repeat protein
MADLDNSVRVEGNVIGSAVITGSGNQVTIVYGADLLRNTAPLGANPYRGLDAFDETSSQLFFGRERLVKSLIERFARLTAPSVSQAAMRLLAIIGPSGSGKSSIARAGLIPAIAVCRADWLRGAKVVVVRPGRNPIRSLADALARLVTGDPNPTAQRQAFEAELRSGGLSRIARENLPGGTPLLVLVDQFEETYTLSRPDDANDLRGAEAFKAERVLFADTLLQAASEPAGPVSVLLTVRSDYLGALAEHAPLSAAVADSHEIVPAMGRDDLYRAVAEPARAAGHPIDTPTIERILDQATDEVSALPLVEFALERIWDRMRDDVSPAETLTALGGIGGALANRAGEVFERQTTDGQKLARKAFLATVQVGDAAARDTRTRAWLDEVLPAGVNETRLRDVLNAFVEARLLAVGSAENGRIWFELPHEALIRNWRLLRGWIETQREDLRFARRLQHAAENWIASRRARGNLWRRPDLDLLRRFAERNVGSLTDLQTSFFAASERQHSAEWWLSRAAVAGLIILAVAAIGFGVETRRFAAEAQQNAREAKNNENEAKKNEIIARSQRSLAEERLTQAQRSQAEAETTLLNYMSSASSTEIISGKYQLAPALLEHARLRRDAFPFDLGKEVDHVLERAALIIAANDPVGGLFPGLQGAFLGPEDDIVSIGVNAEGAVVSNSTHATIRQWPSVQGEVHTGSTPGWRLFARNDDERFFAVNRSSLNFQFSGEDAEGPSFVRVFDRDRSEPVAIVRSRSAFSEMTFVPGTNFLVLTDSSHMRILDASTGRVRVDYVIDDKTKSPIVTREEFSKLDRPTSSLPGYERVAVSPGSEQVFATSTFSGFEKRRVDVFPYPARRLASDDVPLVVTTGQVGLQLEEDASGIFTSPRLGILVVSLQSKVAFYTIPNLKLQKVLEIEGGPIVHVELSHDRRRLAVGTKSGSVQVIDLETAKVVAKAFIDAPVDGLALSSDGRSVAAFSNERHTLHLLDVDTKAVRVFGVPEFDILSVDIARDGSALLLSTTQAVVIRLDLPAAAVLAWKESAVGRSLSLGDKIRVLGHREDGVLISNSAGALLGRSLRGRHIEWIAPAGNEVVAASYLRDTDLADPALSILTASDDGSVVTERRVMLGPALATALLQGPKSQLASLSLVPGRNVSATRSADRLSLLIGHVLIEIPLGEITNREECAPMSALSWCPVSTQPPQNYHVIDLLNSKQLELDELNDGRQLSKLLQVAPGEGVTVDVTSTLSWTGKYGFWGTGKAFFVQNLDQVRQGKAGMKLSSQMLSESLLPADKKEISLGQMQVLPGGDGFIVNLGNKQIAVILIVDDKPRAFLVDCPSSFCTAVPTQEASLLIYNDEYSWSPFSDNRIIEPILFDLKTKNRVTLKGHRDFVNRTATGGKSGLFATGDRSGRVIIWNLAAATEMGRFELNGPIESLFSADDGRAFLAVTDRGVWKIDTSRVSITGPEALEFLAASAPTANADALELKRLALDKLPDPYQNNRPASSQAAAPPAEACAALASHPLDPRRSGRGVPFELIKAEEATKACEAALAADSSDGRSAYHLSRAYAAAKRTDQAHSAIVRAIQLGDATAAAQSFAGEDTYKEQDLKVLSREIRALVEAAAENGAPLAIYALAREAYFHSNDPLKLKPALDAGEPSAFVLEARRLAKINTSSAVEEVYFNSSVADLLWTSLFASENHEARQLRYNSAHRLPKPRVIELHRQALAKAEKFLGTRLQRASSQSTEAAP